MSNSDPIPSFFNKLLLNLIQWPLIPNHRAVMSDSPHLVLISKSKETEREKQRRRACRILGGEKVLIKIFASLCGGARTGESKGELLALHALPTHFACACDSLFLSSSWVNFLKLPTNCRCASYSLLPFPFLALSTHYSCACDRLVSVSLQVCLL